MKHNWQIRRQTQPSPDALQRWDRAYQYLLQWTAPPSPPQIPTPPPLASNPQEVPDACSRLCPRFARQPGPRSDH